MHSLFLQIDTDQVVGIDVHMHTSSIVGSLRCVYCFDCEVLAVGVVALGFNLQV